jgi:hypothetical protein
MGSFNPIRTGDHGIQLLFFSGWATLDCFRGIRPKADYVSYKNIDGFIGTIVDSGKATYHELKTVYSLEEALKIWEVIAVSRYNQYLASERKK